MNYAEFKIYFTYLQRDLMRSFNLGLKNYLGQFEEEPQMKAYVHLLNYYFKK
jgi:hypothetical protein